MRSLLIAVSMLFAGLANATVTTLDFDEFNLPGNLFAPVDGAVSQGFSMQSAPFGYGAVWGTDFSTLGNAVVLVPYDPRVTEPNHDSVVFAAVNGEAFSLASFDYVPTDDGLINISVEWAAGGSFTRQFDGSTALAGELYSTQSTVGMFNDIVSVTFQAVGTSLLMDNVVISSVPVPVPAAVWLFGSALAGLSFIRRKAA